MSPAYKPPEFELLRPWMNAAGSLGFAPELRSDISLESFGAFVTNPISLRSRRTAKSPRFLNFPGGVLLHTGHPNPGLSTVTKNYAPAWSRCPVPIIVHLLSAKPEDLRKALPRIEELENVIAIELSLELDCSLAEVREQARAARGELPLIIQVPQHRAAELAEVAMDNDAAAVSLGPPRGSLPGPDGTLVSGRLYGQAMFPQALAIVAELSKSKIPLIASGGVETKAQGEAMLAAGATSVQIDIALWKSGSIATI